MFLTFSLSYPLFHLPTLTYRVSRGDFNSNRPFFAAVMALCALSAARVRDGALYSNRWDSRTLANPPSSVFFAAAAEAIPKESTAAHDLDYLRTYALLSIAALQNNEVTKMLFYLGTYDMLIKCDGLHDEKSWPVPMSVIEKEERRRLVSLESAAIHNFGPSNRHISSGPCTLSRSTLRLFGVVS